MQSIFCVLYYDNTNKLCFKLFISEQITLCSNLWQLFFEQKEISKIVLEFFLNIAFLQNRFGFIKFLCHDTVTSKL